MKFVLTKKLQCPISSTGRNDSHPFWIGNSYALRTSESQRYSLQIRDQARNKFSRIREGVGSLVYVSYINISTMRLNNRLFVSRPINESKNHMISNYLSNITAYIKLTVRHPSYRQKADARRSLKEPQSLDRWCRHLLDRMADPDQFSYCQCTCRRVARIGQYLLQKK